MGLLNPQAAITMKEEKKFLHPSRVFVRIRPKAISGGHADDDDDDDDDDDNGNGGDTDRRGIGIGNGKLTQKKLSGWTSSSIHIADHHGIEEYDFPKTVLPPEISQEDMYMEMLPAFVDRFTAMESGKRGIEGQQQPQHRKQNLKQGYNVLFFAYGQTGSGKTYSIFGSELSLAEVGGKPNPQWGIFPRVVHEVFDIMHERKSTHQFILTVSAIEFYLGKCYDLLVDDDGNDNGQSKDPIVIDGDDFEPRGHVKTRLESMDDIMPVLAKIQENRTVRATRMNAKTDDCGGSSRSHCALILTLFQVDHSSPSSSGRGKYVKTTFTLVNFAGAARPDKTGKDRCSGMEVMMDLRENRVVKTGAQAFVINWELFEIGTAVIKATKDHQLGRKYIPPRQGVSPFLQFVASCMNGSALTGMLVTVSQSNRCGWETWFTMKYGTDLSKLRVPVKPQVSVDIKEALRITERDLQIVSELLEKTPEVGAPSSKYYIGRKILSKELKERLIFLEEVAVPPPILQDISLSSPTVLLDGKRPMKKSKPHTSSVYVRIKPKVSSPKNSTQYSEEDEMEIKHSNSKTCVKRLSGWTDDCIYLTGNHGTEEYDFPRQVIGPDVSQQEAYTHMLPNFVDSFTMEGYEAAYNVLFFAYGRAESGKRYTIFGSPLSLTQSELHPQWGIFPRVVNHVFQTMDRRPNTKYILTASAIEFYLGGCYDLLADNNRIIIENFEPTGHSKERLNSYHDVVPFLTKAYENRSVQAASTQMSSNTEDSSRSHCALILTLLQLDSSSHQYTKSTFTLVDFAGAETPEKTGKKRRNGSEIMTDLIAGKEIQDGAQGYVINWELFEIGTAVIQATEQHRLGNKYLPPRQLASPFLQFLASCLDGSALLGMVVTISQVMGNGWETWFTMKYGTELSKLRAPIRTQSIMDVKAALDNAGMELAQANEALKKTPETGSPSSKYYSLRVINVKELEQSVIYLQELVAI